MGYSRIKSFAKINLALNVTGKNSRLHNVESIVGFVSLYDVILIKEIQSKKHIISFNGKYSKNIHKENTISKLLNILEKKSPTSMGVTTRQLDISRSLNLKDCLSMEFRICQAMMDRHDFYEGVRANLVDKDRDPKWEPITVDLLEEKLIDDHFKNLEDKELF